MLRPEIVFASLANVQFSRVIGFVLLDSIVIVVVQVQCKVHIKKPVEWISMGRKKKKEPLYMWVKITQFLNWIFPSIVPNIRSYNDHSDKVSHSMKHEWFLVNK